MITPGISADVVIDVVVKATLLLGVAAIAVVLMRRASAASRHLILMAALAGALVLPAARLLLPEIAVPILPAGPAGPTVAASPAGPSDPSDQEPVSVVWVPVPSDVTSTTEPSARNGWTPSVILVWFAGTLLMMARLLGGAQRLRRWREGAIPAADPELCSRVHAAMNRLGLSRSVQVLVGRGAAVPMTWGLRAPSILLPSDASRWTSATLDAVLLHELAHVRRRDALWHHLARVATVVWWFHPMVWWVARQARLERERACDDIVLRAGTTPSAYAAELLAIARGDFGAAVPQAALAMARSSDLPARIRAILDPARTRHGRSIASVIVAGVLVVLVWPLAAAKVSAAVTIAPQEIATPDPQRPTTAPPTPVPPPSPQQAPPPTPPPPASVPTQPPAPPARMPPPTAIPPDAPPPPAQVAPAGRVPRTAPLPARAGRPDAAPPPPPPAQVAPSGRVPRTTPPPARPGRQDVPPRLPSAPAPTPPAITLPGRLPQTAPPPAQPGVPSVPPEVTPPPPTPRTPPPGRRPAPPSPPAQVTPSPGGPPQLTPPAPLPPQGPDRQRGLPAPAIPIIRPKAFPNFSGEWVPRDLERTDALFNVGIGEVPGRGSLVISQTAQTLIVERTGPAEAMKARAAVGTGIPTRSVYNITGAPSTHDSAAGRVTSRAEWEGNRLVIHTTLADGELETSYAVVNGDLQVETTMRRADGRPGSTIRLWFQKVK